MIATQSAPPSPATPADGAPLLPALTRWASGATRIQLAAGVVLVLGDGSAAAYAPGVGALPGARLIPGTDGTPMRDPAGLLTARRAQSDWLLDVTLQRLRERTSAGRPLAAHAPIRLRLAEAAVRLVEADGLVVGLGAGEGWGYAHQCVTDADHLLIELHGGSSVLAGSPGHLALFSSLIGLAAGGGI
ncbi:hypothetical protein [Granulicoccus sp. GXG6511]|uniref:hypothetical protein n=1 Tax=Granulicoccus sp. GXG6511 TaxID=3381351 RepID=UPI003D7F03DA